MTEDKAALITALHKRQDRYSLEQITAAPNLVDDEIIDLALTNGCCRVIRYLRKNGFITAEGSKARKERQLKTANTLIAAANESLPDIEAALEELRRKHRDD